MFLRSLRRQWKNREAIFALERVVDTEHGPARAELAKAYLSLGETDDAKKEFQRARELEDIPPEARQTIDRYLSELNYSTTARDS